MDVVPLGPGFAAELRAITLKDVAADDAAYAAVRAAFEEHSVLVFRGQDVTDDIQLAFSRRFGPPEVTKVGFPRYRLAFRDSLYHRPGRQGGAGRSPAFPARQGQPALAYRLLVQAGARAGVGPVGAHHSRARRRNGIRLHPARLRAARCGVAQKTAKLVCLA